MKRKTKNEKIAEDIIHSIRQANECSEMSDDALRKIILSILTLWYKPVPRKKEDSSWKETRNQCS